jgi:hypothetical protein
MRRAAQRTDRPLGVGSFTACSTGFGCAWKLWVGTWIAVGMRSG